MSHSLTAPPPPALPMKLPKHYDNATSKHNNGTINKQQQTLFSCTWALDYPELQKACFLARVCEQRPPLRCQLRHVSSMLQEGPTCGLTALSMLLGGTPTPQQLLQAAREQHYTNNGEIFSAQNLFQLICDNTKAVTTATATTNANATNANAFVEECGHNNVCTSENNSNNAADRQTTLGIRSELHEGRLDCAKVRTALLAGACLFVPYDPDFNHSPCLKYGHKAHWALIVGYLITNTDEFFVLARHGKAKNLAVWSLQALSDSNANLIEFAQPKGYPDCDFLLPPGGIGGDLGLRERAIIVNELPQQIINIR